jgi:fibronectin-binding autotransporter adhesin
MTTRIFELGYKITKIGGSAVSCSMSALGTVSVSVLATAGALSALAPAANAQTAPTAVDLDTFFSSAGGNQTVTQANGGTGYMIGGEENGAFFDQTGRGFTGDATGTYTDFYTVGGNGSGGGAGLGGVFFVDIDGDLTMRDVQFTGNVARGGTGGGVTPVALRAAEIGLTQREAAIGSAVSFNITPTDLDGAGQFQTIALANANTRFAIGQSVRVDGANGVSTITAIDGNVITLASALTVANTAVQSVADLSVNNGTVTGESLANLGSSASFAVGSLVVGTGIPTGTTLTSVTRNNENVVTSLTLSDSTITNSGNLQFINLPTVEAAQYVSLGAAGTVNLQGTSIEDTARSGLYRIEASAAALGLAVGMELTGTGIPAGTRVTAIDATNVAGKDIVYLSDPIDPTTVFSFDGLMKVGEVGDNYIQLSTPDTRVVVGGFISGNGIPDGTRVESYDSRTGRITLKDQFGDPVNLTGVPESITTSGILGRTDTSITVASADGIVAGMDIQGDGITAGAKVDTVTEENGNFVITLIGGTTTGTVTSFVASSELATGGALNNLDVLSAYSAGTDGNDGKNGNSVLPYITDGEGLEGTPGQGANLNDNEDVDYAPGGVGGDGGDGSNGVPFNYEALKNTKKATGEFIEKVTEAAAALGNAPFPSFSTSAALITASVAKGINLTVEIINSVKWIQGMTEGTVALGGNGGAGGDGGDGGEFYGGGAGGAGGNGGAGALSYTTGGEGGAGGEGGTGGFGAGGGQGGDSGDSGPTGYALEGAPGAGGSAGFGAGEGSDGWNRFGGGGSGYGGAVFVRGSVDGTTGGQLTIEGNALFRDNYVLGGSSTNGGEAGQAAGSDLFIMKGARVDLMPGVGRTIRFEGSIADNSIASIEGGSWSSGEGADLHVGGGGLVQLAGENTYSGTTYIHGSTTEVTLGVGIHPDSSIKFAGAGEITGSGGIAPHFGAGTLFLAEDVVQRVGAIVPGQISWNGAGGFSAATADGIVLNFGRVTDEGAGQKLYWGSSYLTTDSTLVFGSEYSLGSVTWMNDIDLQTHTGNIVVFDSQQIDDATGDPVADLAFVRGDLTNGALRVGDTGYDGTLLLLGTNDLTGVTVEEGLVMTSDGTTTGRLFDTTNGGFVVVNDGGGLVLAGSETVTTVDVAQGGILVSSQGLTSSDTLTNDGVMLLSGVNNLTSVWNRATGDIATNDDMNVTAGVLRNDGRWDILADQTITIDDADAETSTDGLIGTGLFCLETSGDDAEVCNGGDAVDQTAAAANLEIAQAGDTQFAGSFGGLGALTTTGAGTLTLTNGQTFTGGLFVNAGQIVTQAASSAAFHDDLAITVGSAGTLSLNTVDTVGSLTNNGTVGMNADITADAMTNTGVMTLAESVTLTTSVGGLNAGGTINAGGSATLDLAGGLSGSGTVNIAENGTLNLNQADAFSMFDGTIIGANTTLTVNDTGVAESAGVLTFGTGATVDVARLEIANATVALDGSEILDDAMTVYVGTNGALRILDDADASVVRQESVFALQGEGEIYLGRNTFNIENGGAFDGEFFGTGTLNVASGDFTINSAITSEDGTFTVSNNSANPNANTNTMIASGATVDVQTVEVAARSTMHVAGTGSSAGTQARVAADTINVAADGTVQLGAGDGYTDGEQHHSMLEAGNVMVAGTVRGNGTVAARDTIRFTGSSTMRPGDSPGVQNYTAQTTQFAGSSVLEIEVLDATLAAGVGYDRINIAGNLEISEQATLEVIELVGESGFNPSNFVLGSVVRFAGVAPDSVTGTFDRVVYNGTNNFAVNLATGALVGLGDKSIADAASNPNQAAILAGMQATDGANGSPVQYYGGAFLENLTDAWARDENLDSVFEKASPELYAGLSASAQSAVMNNGPRWVGGFALSDAATSNSFDISVANFGSDTADSTYQAFGVRSTNANFVLNVASDDVTFLFNMGTVNTRLDSETLASKGSGVSFGLTALGMIPSLDGTVWTAGLQYANLDMHGQRVANNGIVSFDDVRAQASQFNIGVEHHGSSQTLDYGFKADLQVGSSKSVAFSETAGAMNGFDAMDVAGVSSSYTRFNLGMQLGSEVARGTRVVGAVDVAVPMGSDPVVVGASYDQGQAAFDVSSRGLDGSNVSFSVGVDQDISDSGVLSARVGAENTWDGDTGVSAGLSLKFNF